MHQLIFVCVRVCVFNALEEDSSEQEKCILSRLQKYLCNFYMEIMYR